MPTFTVHLSDRAMRRARKFFAVNDQLGEGPEFWHKKASDLEIFKEIFLLIGERDLLDLRRSIKIIKPVE